jgi:hypothetical protein
MSRNLRRTSSAIISAITVASLLGFAGPASALVSKVPLDCFGEFGAPTIPTWTRPDVAVNYAGDAACVGVKVTATSVRLAWVVRAPGWTYEVRRNGGGTQARVELRFTNQSTGEKLDFRYQLGRVTIG